MKTHSKIEIEKVFTDVEGNEYALKAKKLNAFTLQTEAFKIMKTIAVAAGTSVDAKAVGMAWTAVGEAIYENFTDDQFVHIRDMLMSEVYYKDSNDEWKKCDVEYWDDKEFFLDVTFWLIKENFVNFIQRSSMFRHLLNQWENLTGINVKENFEKKMNELMNLES